LRGKIGKSIRDIIWQLCEWRCIEILEGNIQIDHIHYKDKILEQTKLWEE